LSLFLLSLSQGLSTSSIESEVTIKKPNAVPVPPPTLLTELKADARRNELTVKADPPPADPCNPSPCDPSAQCTATSATDFNCACNVGYNGNGLTCTEIDPCTTNPCDPNATCRKTAPGEYTCSCNDGYISNGDKCDAVMDHTAEEQRDEIDKNLQDLEDLQTKKQFFLKDLGRARKLEELSENIADLAREKKERDISIEEHNLDHVEDRMKKVEETAKQLADAERRQNSLIKDLKLAKLQKAKKEKEELEQKIELISLLKQAAQKKIRTRVLPPVVPLQPLQRASSNPLTSW